MLNTSILQRKTKRREIENALYRGKVHGVLLGKVRIGRAHSLALTNLGRAVRVGFPEAFVEMGILVSGRAKTNHRSMLGRVDGQIMLGVDECKEQWVDGWKRQVEWREIKWSVVLGGLCLRSLLIWWTHTKVSEWRGSHDRFLSSGQIFQKQEQREMEDEVKVRVYSVVGG